jgi:hypothetical protein
MRAVPVVLPPTGLGRSLNDSILMDEAMMPG